MQLLKKQSKNHEISAILLKFRKVENIVKNISLRMTAFVGP